MDFTVHSPARSIDDIAPEIVKGLREGDHRAYEQVFIHYKKPIENFLVALTRDRETAREITQEIFMNVWIKREAIDPSKSIKNYLYRIARNAAINHFNQQKVKEKYERFVTPLSEEDISGSDKLLIAKETELLIEIAVNRMPKLRKRVFEMSRYDGLSNEEIADRLGLTRESVASHIYLATKDIKEVISLFILLFIAQ